MKLFALAVSRVCISAWVGAASLFVVTSVREVTAPQFDSATRSVLATLRFPAYYAFAFGLVGMALVTALIAPSYVSGRKRRMHLYQALLVLALAAIAADYAFIYPSLAQMTSLAEAARPANFQDYHSASVYVNGAQLACCLLASFVVCWPSVRRQDHWA